MTREEFIKILKEKGYSYKIEGDNLVVTHDWNVNLNSLVTLPSGVEFRNEGNVNLNSLVTLPSGVEFRNEGDVDLRSLKTISHGVEFRNEGDVNLNSLVGGFFEDWRGNIEGINNKKLLNFMISKGVFI